MRFVYLGYGIFDAYTNLALDEIMLHSAIAEQRPFIRFYGFERPALILARSEHIDDIRRNGLDSVDVSRRISHGSVIWCDKGVLAYSIAAPEAEYKCPKSAHIKYGTAIANALGELGVPSVGIGEHFSVRAGGKTIAGHGQYWQIGKGGLYHGVLAVEPWSADLLDKYIALRPGEKKFIAALPALRHYSDISVNELVQQLLHNITNGNYQEESINKYEYLAKGLVNSKYKNDGWVYNPGGRTKRNLGFCFVDLISPENFVYI